MTTNGVSAAQSEGIFVVGEGKVTALPNRLVLTLAVESRGANATQAYDNMTQRTQHLIRVLMEQGVAHTDMQTVWAGMHPIGAQVGAMPVKNAAGYPSPPAPPSHPGAHAIPNGAVGLGPGSAQTALPQPAPERGYAVGSWLCVTVREPHRLGELLDTATAAGAAFAAGVVAGIEDDTSLRCAALSAAIKDAWAKAEVLALASGRQLGQVLTLTEELLPLGTQPLAGTTNALTELTFSARVHVHFACI